MVGAVASGMAFHMLGGGGGDGAGGSAGSALDTEGASPGRRMSSSEQSGTDCAGATTVGFAGEASSERFLSTAVALPM